MDLAHLVHKFYTMSFRVGMSCKSHICHTFSVLLHVVRLYVYILKVKLVYTCECLPHFLGVTTCCMTEWMFHAVCILASCVHALLPCYYAGMSVTFRCIHYLCITFYVARVHVHLHALCIAMYTEWLWHYVCISCNYTFCIAIWHSACGKVHHMCMHFAMNVVPNLCIEIDFMYTYL